MTEWLLALVPTYGLPLLAVCTFLSCLALPIPASMLLLAAGGFVSAGDLPLAGVAVAAMGGAMLGDQVIYTLGKRGGPGLMKRLETRLGKRAAPLGRAMSLLEQRGGIAVFLSRWLISALGPYVNLASGMARLHWPTFTVCAIAGEIVWVGMYLGLGYSFTGNLAAASDMALNILGLLAVGVVALGLGWWLYTLSRAQRG